MDSMNSMYKMYHVLTTTRPARVWYLTPWLGLYFSFRTWSDSTLIPETPAPCTANCA